MAEETSRTRYCANCLTTFLGNPRTCANAKCARERPGTHWGKLLEPGERIDGRFRIDRRLRIAAAGPTYLCQETDDREQAVGPLVIVQVLSPEAVQDTAYFERLEQEVGDLHDLEHPNVIRIQKMQPPVSGPPYLIVHYEEGGTLLDQLREQGAMNLTQVAQVGLQICESLRAVHQAGLVHGDLNPDRIILKTIPDKDESPMIRVTDFGALKTQGTMSGGHDPAAFSPQYAAPERINGSPPSIEADIYAVGSLLLFTLSLQPLIAAAERMDLNELYETLTEHLPPRWTPPPSLGVDASQIAFFNAVLNATMSIDPADRCELNEIQEYLEAILEVQDEEVFEAPKDVTDPEPEAGTLDESSADTEQDSTQFNAFAESPTPTESDDEPAEKKEAPAKKPTAGTPQEEDEPDQEESLDSEEDAPRRQRDWIKIAHRGGVALSVVTTLFLITSIWFHTQKPHWLPPSWLEADGPAPLEIIAGDPANQPDYEALTTSLNLKKNRLKKCGLEQDSLSVFVIVQPNGRVGAAGSSYLPTAQRRCVRKKLLGMVLKRRSRTKPLRIRTTLVF